MTLIYAVNNNNLSYDLKVNEDQMLKAMELENNHSYNEPCCSPYLTVSTAHVSDKTIELINQDQEGASMPELEGFVIYRKTLYNEIVGWFLYIDLNADASPWPEDLFAIAGLAKEHGADLVCLDRDGPIVEDLPFFESKI